MALNYPLWYEIEEDLGTVTDLEIVRNDKGCEIRFKSNGIDKMMFSTDREFKMIIQAAYYVTELISPLKKYKHSSLNLQQTQ